MLRDALTCPYCGEPLETDPDPGGATEQEYIEDCAVCCRPVRFVATYDEETSEYVVVAAREG